MSYQLQALIGQLELITVVAAEVPAARPAPLGQGLALIPATNEFLDAVSLGYDEERHGFWWFPGGFERRLAAWSKAGPIACVEADYFGGHGSQYAAVWADGLLALGPLETVLHQPFPPQGSPISQALRRLGAQAHGHCDEFDSVGLLRQRRTEDWAG